MLCSARFPNKLGAITMNARERATLRFLPHNAARAIALQIPRDGITVRRCKPGKAYGLAHGFTNYAVHGRTFVTCQAASAMRSVARQVYVTELVRN
jgi:hypothetical protein